MRSIKQTWYMNMIFDQEEEFGEDLYVSPAQVKADIEFALALRALVRECGMQQCGFFFHPTRKGEDGMTLRVYAGLAKDVIACLNAIEAGKTTIAFPPGSRDCSFLELHAPIHVWLRKVIRYMDRYESEICAIVRSESTTLA